MAVSLENFEEIWSSSKLWQDEKLLFTSPRSAEVCCRRGIIPCELLPRPKESFQQPQTHLGKKYTGRSRSGCLEQNGKGTKIKKYRQRSLKAAANADDDVAQLRYERFEIQRRQLLRELRRERQRLISDEKKKKRIYQRFSLDESSSSDISSLTKPSLHLPSLIPQRDPGREHTYCGEVEGIRGRHCWSSRWSERPDERSLKGSMSKSYVSGAGSCQTTVSEIDMLYDQIEDVLQDREFEMLQKSRHKIRQELGNYAAAKMVDRKNFLTSLSKEMDHERSLKGHHKREEDKRKIRKQHFEAISAKRIEVIARRHLLENKEILDAKLKLAMKSNSGDHNHDCSFLCL